MTRFHSTVLPRSWSQCRVLIHSKFGSLTRASSLLHEATVAEMKPGSVVVDLAVEQGGNCPLSRLDEVVTTPNGVRIVGYPNLATRVAADASSLYARNVLDFLKLIIDKEGQLTVNLEDDIVAATLMCKGGELRRKN